MNKRRGYYDLTIKYSKVTGFDSNDEEIIEESDLRLRGHFSINFWSSIEEKYKAKDLMAVFSIFSEGITMSKFKDLVYFSHMAYCSETGAIAKFVNMEQCGQIIEQMSQEQRGEVTEALLKSQVLQEILEVTENEKK